MSLKSVVASFFLALLALFAGPAARLSRAQTYVIDGTGYGYYVQIGDNLGDYAAYNSAYATITGTFLPTTALQFQNQGILDLQQYQLTVASISSSDDATSGYGTNLIGTSVGGALLIIDGNSTATFGGVIGDASTSAGGGGPSTFGNTNIALQISGANTVQGLTGVNNYTGGTTITGGATLNINADAALGAITAPLTFAGNSTLQAGAEGITLSSSRSITINNGVTGTFDTNSNNMTINGVIGGQGNLAKTGSGTLTLSASTTYSGATVIKQGTLLLGTAPVPPPPAGATAVYTFANVAPGNPTLVPNAANPGTYDGTLENGALAGAFPGAPGGYAMQLGPNNSGTYLQVPGTGNNGIVPTTNGTYTYSAWFYGLYGGATATSWRTLFRGSDNNGGDHELIIQSGSDNLGFYGNGAGGNFQGTGFSMAPYNNLSTWNQITVVANGSTSTYYIDGQPVGSVNKVSNAGLFAIGNYQGGNQVFSKYLDDVYVYNTALSPTSVQQLYNATSPKAEGNALPSTTPVIIAANATLDLNGTSLQVASLSDYAPASGGNIISSNGTATAILTLSPTGTSTTFSGSIQNGASGAGVISLVMNGNGTQVLAGNNIYTGGTTVQSGILEAASTSALPGYPSVSVSVSGGATLAVQTANWNSGQIGTLAGNVTWSSSNAMLGLDTSGGSFTYGSFTQNSGLNKLGPNALILTGASTYPGPTMVGGGTLQVGTGGSGASIGGTSGVSIAGGATLFFDHADARSVSGPISGGGNLANTGGTLTLAGNGGTYSGGTSIGAGSMLVSAAYSALGTGPVTINGGTLSLAAPVTASTGPIGVTGFNISNIAANTAASPNAATDGNTFGWHYFETGAPGDPVNGNNGFPAGPHGLPTTGLITSLYAQADGSHTQFQLQPYGTSAAYLPNNIGLVGNGGSLTMSLSMPENTASLRVLFNGQNGGNYNVTLNFADGTTYAINGNPYQDWTSYPPNEAAGDHLAFANADLVGQNNTWTGYWNGGVISLIENDFTVPAADQQKLLKSVTFTPTGGGGLMIFALSANNGNLLSNNVNVTADSTINVSNSLTASMGNLSIGNNTLSITGDSGASLTLGAASLTGTASTFNVAGATSLTFTGAVTGGSAVNMIGGGTLVLADSNNSYSGNLTIGDAAGDIGGTVAAGGAGALGASTAGVIINNGILDIQNGYAEASNAHPITLNNANSTIQVDAGTYTPSLSLSFGANGALTKTGAGTLALTNLTLNTVQNVTAAGGAINFGGTSVNVNNLTLSGGAVDNGTVNVAGTILAQSGSAGAQLSGNVSLNKTTGGTVVLGSSANNYSGGTNISAGILQINATGQLPVGGTVTMSGGTLQFSPIVAGLTSIYYGGTQANNNNGALNLPGVSATAQNINNLNLNNLETYVAGIPVGLTTNTTVKVGNTASWFNNSGSGMFDSVPNGPNYSVDPADNFIDVHTGFFYAPVSGTYQFQAGGDDVGRLWLDNNNAETVYNGGTSNIYLTAGEHPITIVHEEYGGGQNTYANVQGPAGSGINNQNIPNSMLTTATSSVSYNTNVTLPASSTSTIDVQGTSLVSLNALTLYNGSQLNTTSSFLSNMSSVQFNSTTLNDGTYTLNILGPSLAAGVFTTSGGTSLVNVIGTGTLVLNSSNSSLSGTTFNVGGSNTLMIVGGGGAFASQAGAAITLQSGATLQLATADTTPANYDLPGMLVTSASNSNVTYRAGMDFAGEGGAVANGIVNLSNGGSPFTVPTGQTLGFAANSGYTLNIVPQVNVASGGTLNGIGGATGVVNMTLNNSPGATVAPNNDNFIVLNLQGTNGQFSPSGTALANGLQGLGNVTFAGGFSGNTSQLTPAVNGFLTFPTANMIMSGSTVNVAGGGFILGNIQSLGAVPSQVTLELNGGTLGASNPLTINNPLIFGPNQSVNIAVATNMIAATSQIQFTSNISLTSGLYTFNDPFGRSTFWGVLSGAGSVAFTPTNGNPNNNTYNDQPYNNYVNGQTYSSPEIAGFNTYIGGTTINSTIVAITDRQAFGTGQLNYNWGGINALTNLTGELAVANPWSDIANFNNGEMWFRGPNSIDLSGPGTINYNSMFRIPDGGTVTISGAISGSGYFQRGGDPNGTLVLNDPLSTYTGAAGGQDWFYNSAVNNPSAYNVTGRSFDFPATSFWKNDNGGDQNVNNGNASTNDNAVVLMVGSLGGSGTNVTSGPFGTGTVRWQYWGALANGTSTPLTVGNDFVMEGDMGINGGVGLNLSGDMMIGNRDRNGGYRDLYTSGNVTLSGRLISTNAWNNNNGAYEWAGLDLRTGSGGVVTLSGDNSMLSSVEITQGTLVAASNTALGSLAWGSFNPGPVQLGNGNTAGTNDGTLGLLLTGPVTVANSISVNNDGNGTTLGGNTNNSATFSGPISLAKGVNIASSATGGNTLLFSGVISNGSTTGSVNVVGPGNVTFAAANTYSGPTTLSGGLLTLDFSQGTSPTSNIVSGSSALILAGGNLSIVPNGGQTNSQTFASTTVNPGASTVSVGGGVLNLAAITRNVGGTVDFSGAGTINTTGQPANSILLDTNGVAYATVAGTDWAAVNGSGAIVPVGSYTPSTAGGSEFVAGNNIDVSSGVNTQLPLASGSTIASLRFNQGLGNTIDVNGGTLTTGGILVTPSDGGSSIIDSLGGGSLQGPTAGSDLVVIQNSSQPFTISANITRGGLTKSGSGALVLGGTNTYSGTTYVNGGMLQGPVASLPTNIVTSHNATVTINDPSSSATFNNSISGNGSLTVNMTSGGNLTLSGNNTYTGATNLVNGTLVFGANPVVVNGFGGNGTNWTKNGGPTIAGNVLTLTDNNNNEARSAYYNTPVPTNAPFVATFTYQLVNPNNPADGCAFLFQNAGLNALGGGGGDLGMGGITPSAAVEFDIYNGHTIGTNYSGSGLTAGNGGPDYLSSSPVNLAGGDPINVRLSYDGSNLLVETLTDASNGNTYSHTFTVGSLATTTGGNTAYVGFAGGTGGLNALQQISNFNLLDSATVNVLPSTTQLTISANATLDLNGGLQTVAGLSDGIGGGAVINNNSTVASILTLSPSGGATSSFSGTIAGGAGTISLVMNGNGTQILSGNNIFTGPTTISAGAIQLGNPNALGHSSVVSVSVSQGLLFGPGVTSANFNILNDSGNLALVNADGNNVALTLTGGTLSGVLSDNGTGPGGSVTANLTGNLLVQNARNTYSGPTTITNGTFQANDGGGLPAASALTLNNAILQSDGPAVFNRTLSAVATAPGSFAMTGASGFAANGGYFTVNLGGQTPPTQLTWGSGGLLNVNTLAFGSATGNNTVEFQNGIDLAGSTGTVQVASGTGGDSALMSGSIVDSTSGANTALVKTGAGQLTLSGNNQFAGGVTIAAGTVQMASSNALGVAVTPTVNFPDGGMGDLQLNGYSLSPNLVVGSTSGAGAIIENANGYALPPAPVTLTLNPAPDQTFAGTIRNGANAGSLSLVKAGSNTLTLTGTNSFSGPVSVPAGALVGNSFSLPTSIALGSSALASTGSVTFNQQVNGLYSHTVSGTGSLTKTGGGTLVLGGANTYTGATNVLSGTLQIGVPVGHQAYQIAANHTTGNQTGHTGSLGYDFTVNAPIDITQLGFYDSGLDGLVNSHTVDITNQNNTQTFATAAIPAGTAATLSDGYRFVTLASPVVLAPGTYRIWGYNFGNGDADWNDGNNIPGPTDPGLGNEINFNPGNINAGYWQTANTFPTNQDGDNFNSAYRYGAVSFTFFDPAVDNVATGSVPSGTALSVAAGATFDLSSTTQAVGSLADYQGSGGTVAVGLGTLTVGGNGASTTFSGVITGAGLLVKTGSGTLSLTGASGGSYTGGTTINAGTLQAVNSLGTGPLNINNATFRASGNFSVSGPVTLGSANSTISVDLNQTLTVSSSISGAGALNKAGAGTLGLTAQSTYSGATVISGGTLLLAPTTPVPLPSNLTAVYNFASSPGGTVSNIVSPGTYDGTLQNGALTIAMAGAPGGNALELGPNNGNNNANTYLQVPGAGNNGIPTTNGVYTASAWFYGLYSSSTASSWRTLFRGNPGGGGGGGSDHELIINSGGDDLGFYDNTHGGGFVDSGYNISAYENLPTWNQITVVANGTTSTYYINGQQVGTVNEASTSGIYAIGSFQGNNQVFSQYLANVYIYNNTALSTARVMQLYDATGGVPASVLPAATTVMLGAASGTPTLDLNGVQQVVGALSDNAGYTNGLVTNSSTNAVTLTLTPSGGVTSTFSGTIQDGNGGVSLVLNGMGTQVLAGTSSYTGVTTIAGSMVLAVTNLQNGLVNSSIGASSNSYTNLVIDGGTLQYTGSGSTTDRGITLGMNTSSATFDASGSGPVAFTNNGNLVFANPSPSAPGTVTFQGSSTAYNAFGLSIQDSNNYPTTVVKNGPGTWALTAQSQYSGPTQVNAGKLVLAVDEALDETAITVAAGATLAVQTGGGTINTNTTAQIAGGASLTLQSGATFDMTNGRTAAAVGTFNLQPYAGAAPPATTSLTLGDNGGGATMNFDLSSTGADELVASWGTAAVFPGNQIGITALGSLNTSGTYTIISVPGGGLNPLDFSLANSTVTAGGSTYNLHLTGNADQEQVYATLAVVTGPSIWQGPSGHWNATNTASWTNSTVPNSAGAGAVFNQVTGGTNTITLDTPQTVGTLVLGDSTGSPTPTSYILTGSTLTMNNNGSGATITAANGSHLIDDMTLVMADSAGLTVSGSGTLTVDSSSSITDLGQGYKLTLNAPGGTLILSGSNTYGGGTDVASGTLIAMNSASIPSGTSLIVGSGGAFTFAPATTLAPAASHVASASLMVSPVPEPGTIALLLAALTVCCGYRIARRGNKQS